MPGTSAFKVESQSEYLGSGFTGFQPSRKQSNNIKTHTHKFHNQGENLPERNRWRIKQDIQYPLQPSQHAHKHTQRYIHSNDRHTYVCTHLRN